MLHTTRRGALRGVAGLLAGVAGGWPLVQAHAYRLSTPWGNKALLALNRLEVELLDAQIRKRELVSPIDGVISSVDFEAGDFVAPGQNKPVVTIVEIDRLRATFHVPSQQAIRLAVGDRALLQLAQTVQSVEGMIETISPVTDPRTGTVQVRIVIPNSSHTFRSGWRCEFLPAGSSQPATQAKQPDAATVK